MIKRVIIAGGRDFNNYGLMKQKCKRAMMFWIGKPKIKIIIVSGKARGADTLGEQFAKEMGFEVEEYPADWDEYGKAAGAIRNEQMASNSEYLMAFWDGKSRGTAHMIKTARRKGLEVRIIKY